MELSNDFKNVVCVYKVTCIPNGKIIIGSTRDLYKRVIHYRNDKNKQNPLKHYNRYLYNDIVKYGIDNFTIEIVEKFNIISDIELKNKETEYMNIFNSINPSIGYNIRQDVDGKMICSEQTRELKRIQTKEQWEAGVRDNHSNVMKDYWKNNDERKKEVGNMFKVAKTKYVYDVYDRETNAIIKADVMYEDLNKYVNLEPQKIAGRFCHLAKKANMQKIINLGIDLDIYKNTLYLIDVVIKRKEFKI